MPGVALPIPRIGRGLAQSTGVLKPEPIGKGTCAGIGWACACIGIDIGMGSGGGGGTLKGNLSMGYWSWGALLEV